MRWADGLQASVISGGCENGGDESPRYRLGPHADCVAHRSQAIHIKKNEVHPQKRGKSDAQIHISNTNTYATQTHTHISDTQMHISNFLGFVEFATQNFPKIVNRHYVLSILDCPQIVNRQIILSI